MRLADFSLAPQSYGIATAGNTFGGPRGVWLECTGCPASHRIVGPDPLALSDAEAGAVFRNHGWVGEGARLLKAKCPKCATLNQSGEG